MTGKRAVHERHDYEALSIPTYLLHTHLPLSAAQPAEHDHIHPDRDQIRFYTRHEPGRQTFHGCFDVREGSKLKGIRYSPILPALLKSRI